VGALRLRQALACRFLCTIIASAATAGTVSAATLSGTITDQNGRAIVGATVVVSTPVGTTAEVVTDARGAYEVRRLPAGQYAVRVLADGFHAEPHAATLDDDGSLVELSIQLRVSAISESIVVSAAHIDLPLSSAADSITVLTAADLQSRQVETVSEALRLVPGLSIVRSGGRGAITSIFPRGGGSNYTLVLVDGMRVNAFGGGYDFGHLSAADVDRVEVVRGPQSAVFGSDAIGGVVQVVTRRGGPPRADALVEGGGEGTVRAAAGAAGTWRDWRWGIGMERAHSDGFTGRASNGETVSNDDYDRGHVSGTLGWLQPGGLDIRLHTRIGRDERGYPGPFGADPIGVFPGVDRTARGINDTRQVGVRASHPWSRSVRQRVETSYSRLSGDFVSGFGPSESGTRRLTARLQEDLVIGPAASASAGVEVLRERGSSTFVTGPSGAPIPIDRTVTGTYVELRATPRERLHLNAGLRVERLTRDALAPDPNVFAPRPAFAAQTIASVNPKISVSYVAAGSGASAFTRLHASAGTGIRPPDVFEIAFTDNPDLAPERNRSIEVGVDQHLAGGASVLTATFFYNRFDDLIVAVGRSLRDASRYRTDNISNARASGVELSGRARLPRRISLRATYTFMPTELLSVDGLDRLAPAPFEAGAPLIRRPRHQAVAGLTYAGRRLSAFAELVGRSRVLDLEPNFGSFGGLFDAPGHSVMSAGLSVPLARGVQVFARLSNLTNRAYEETLGYPALGRTGVMGVRFAASR
jgi:vitamin B12 transporter